MTLVLLQNANPAPDFYGNIFEFGKLRSPEKVEIGEVVNDAPLFFDGHIFECVVVYPSLFLFKYWVHHICPR